MADPAFPLQTNITAGVTRREAAESEAVNDLRNLFPRQHPIDTTGWGGTVLRFDGTTGLFAPIAATPAPTADTVALRDAAGRLQAADPVADQDVATKAYGAGAYAASDDRCPSLSAAAMHSAWNSPTLSSVGPNSTATHPVWLLDAAATEACAGILWLPSGLTAINVLLATINPTTNTGNAFFTISVRAVDGTSGSSQIAVAVLTVTAGGQYAWVEHPLNVALTGIAINPNLPLYLSARRTGGDAADTLAGDIGVAALIVEGA